MKMKSSELIGDALDRAVGIAMRLPASYWSEGKCAAFSTDWSHGGPIIERENIELKYLGYDNPPYWGALKFSPSKYERKAAIGPSPLIAAMRAFVASKLGDEVEIPEGITR